MCTSLMANRWSWPTPDECASARLTLRVCNRASQECSNLDARPRFLHRNRGAATRASRLAAVPVIRDAEILEPRVVARADMVDDHARRCRYLHTIQRAGVMQAFVPRAIE